MKRIRLDLTKPITDITVKEDTEFWGVFSGKNTESIKQSFRVIHNKGGLKSRIHIKVVLKDSASFDLTSLIIVNKGAKLCDTYLKIDVLLLSSQAHARVIPELLIRENEVKAGHGATIGKLDPEQLTYLYSRGLSPKKAAALLISAFLKQPVTIY